MFKKLYDNIFSLPSSFASVFLGTDLPKIMSKNNPVNTKIAPYHCLVDRTFPNITTEHNTVKNFRVVVTTEHDKGPNPATYYKKMMQ